MESHVHIKENPKASTRCDGQSLSFHLFQNAGYLFTYRLPLDKSCNIKNGVYYETIYLFIYLIIIYTQLKKKEFIRYKKFQYNY